MFWQRRLHLLEGSYERHPVMAEKHLWEMVLLVHATIGTLPLAVLAVAVLYCLYVVKTKLGIDIFPGWGLHLPGPRALLRGIVDTFRS